MSKQRVSCTCIITSLFLLILVVHPGYGAAPAKGLGMWVWSESSFSTDEARQKLIRFCRMHQISHLDVHINISADTVRYVVQQQEALRDFVLLAGMHNITIAALRGSPQMFFSERHDQTLRELHAIVSFYKTLPKDSFFKGIKYDVEPYRTQEWKTRGESRTRVLRDYLTFLAEAREFLHRETPGLWLAADVPFWWDKDELVMEYDGKTKRFSEHVQDVTDFVTVMSYRRSVKGVLDCVEQERRYAREHKKIIIPSVETVKLQRDSHISFWGVSSEEFWNVVAQVLEIAKADPSLGGVMIHCYRSFVEKPDSDTVNRKLLSDSRLKHEN